MLQKSTNALSIEEKLDDIEKKIRNLNEKELNRILEIIEDAISH